MKVWKSPVFYFGIVLVLAVFSAVLAPFVVDWGTYRAELEAYGEKLTGRKVEIAGPIGVRLFPWPRLAAQDVRIANPEGYRDEWFATAGQIVVRMNLGSLFNAEIQVESINVDSPTIKLRRSLDGSSNWHFEPAENIRNSRLLDQVKLDQITLSNGTVQLADERRSAYGEMAKFNATFSALSLAGPWRSSGSFDYGAVPLAFAANTGAWVSDEPLGLGLRIFSRDNSGYSYFLDGSSNGGQFDGTLRLDPTQSVDGKSDTEGQFRPVTYKSKITASFEKVTLSEIEIRPAGAADQGMILSGNANFILGKQVKATADFSAPRVDFDALAGAGARRLLRDGDGLSLVNGLLAGLPDAIDLRSSIKVAALKTGGEVLDNVLLDISANRNEMRIHELSASLPGRSRSHFEGIFFPGAQFAELAGTLAVKSPDARQLSHWLWPDSKSEIARNWTGLRGNLEANADLKLTASKLDLQNIDYVLDGEAGKAGLWVLVNGERPIVDLRIDMEAADIDSYIPNGLAALSSDGSASWSGIAVNFIKEQVKRDLHLTFQAGTLRLNGVEASDVAVDLETTVRGFNLNTIEAGLAGGAKLSVSGNVMSEQEGPDGSIGISLTAEDPRGLLRLTGLLPRDKSPRWASVLGETNLKIDLQAKPSAAAPATHFSVIGKVGDLDISSNGSFTMATGMAGMGLKGTTEIKSPSSATLFNLFGGASETVDAIPARAILTADGALQDGFQVDLQSELYRSTVKFNGKVNPDRGRLALDGNLTVQSAQAQDLLAALRIPALAASSGDLSLATRISTDGTVQSFDEIEVRLSDFTLTGSAALKDETELTGDFDVGDISLVKTMAPVFLPWNGSAEPLEETFAKTLPFGLTGVVWVRPKSLEIYPGFAVDNAQVGITATADVTEFIASAKTEEGDDIVVQIAARQAAEGRKITGQVAVPIDVFQHLKRNDGRAVAAGLASVDVKFEGVGRSPGGVLAMLNGKGIFALQDGKLLNVTPENFSNLILTAKDVEGLELAFAGLRSGDGVMLGPVSGPLTIVNGVAAFTPFGVTGPDAQVLVKPIAELAGGKIDIGVVLSLKALPELPPMEISYSGQPSQLVPGEDRAALTTYLGFKVLERSVDELEKVQAEQERLAIEEEKLRKSDEDRLTAYYAQRAELRLRQRELKVHSAQRILDIELAKVEVQRLIRDGSAINKTELRLRQHELRVHRKVMAAAKPLAVPPPDKPIAPPEKAAPLPVPYRPTGLY